MRHFETALALVALLGLAAPGLAQNVPLAAGEHYLMSPQSELGTAVVSDSSVPMEMSNPMEMPTPAQMPAPVPLPPPVPVPAPAQMPASETIAPPGQAAALMQPPTVLHDLTSETPTPADPAYTNPAGMPRQPSVTPDVLDNSLPTHRDVSQVYIPPMTCPPPGMGPGSEKPYVNWGCVGKKKPTNFVFVDAILWRMEHDDSIEMAVNPGTGEEVYSDDLELDFELGSRVMLRHLSDDAENLLGFEMGFFGIYDWSDTESIEAPTGTSLRLPDTLGNTGETIDFATADAMDLDYESEISSAELNLIFGDPQSNLRFLLGPRYLYLGEGSSIYAFNDDRMSSYEIDIRNSMWGVQAGAELQGGRGPWEWAAFFKVGGFSNRARQSTLLLDNDRTEVLRDFSTRQTKNSAVFDTGITLSRQLSRVWRVRAGYNAFWMSRVVRAADQYDFSANSESGSSISFGQDAIAHGLNLGLEARW